MIKSKEKLRDELGGEIMKKFKCPNCHRESEHIQGVIWVVCGCGYEMIEIKNNHSREIKIREERLKNVSSPKDETYKTPDNSDYPEEIEEYDRELIREHFSK